MKLIKCAKVPFKCMNGFYYYLDTDIPEKEFRDAYNIMLRNEIKLLQKQKNNLNLRIRKIENELLKLYEKIEKV